MLVWGVSLPDKPEPAVEAEFTANDNSQILLVEIFAQQQLVRTLWWASRRPVLAKSNLSQIQGITLYYKLKVW
jgi:hypothetical protein